MLSEKFLQNTGAVRDLCQDVCASLNSLIENKNLGEEEKTLLQDYYKQALNSTAELTELGYFNKKMEEANKNKANKLIESILKIESYGNKIVKKIWANEISDLETFNQNNFKLCVKALPLNMLTLSKDVIDAFSLKEDFVSCCLISNRNIITTPPNFEESSREEHFSFGLIYEVNNNFVMASEVSNLVSVKPLESEIDNMRSEDFKSGKVCINGKAVKLKTPNLLIANNLDNVLQTNNNVVILDGSTKPIGLFCLSYDIKKVNLLKRRLLFIADKLGVPLIEIDILNFYKNNKESFTGNTLARKIFNGFVDKVCADLQLYCRYDFKEGAKKLIGLNTNLRYNFLFKFSQNINNFLEDVSLDEKATAEFIVEKFKRAVEKHNKLTKSREKSNGEPLFFPNETVFISLPKDFLN